MHPVRRLLMGDDAATEEAILAAAVENATSAAEPTAQRHRLHFRLSSHFVAEEGEGGAEEEGDERAPSEALSVLMLMIDAPHHRPAGAAARAASSRPCSRPMSTRRRDGIVEVARTRGRRTCRRDRLGALVDLPALAVHPRRP